AVGAPGLRRVGELRPHRIADGLDDVALVLLDDGGGLLGVAVEHGEAGGVAEALEVVGGADDVGEEDGQGGLVAAELLVNLRARLEQAVEVPLGLLLWVPNAPGAPPV